MFVTELQRFFQFRLIRGWNGYDVPKLKSAGSSLYFEGADCSDVPYMKYGENKTSAYTAGVIHMLVQWNRKDTLRTYNMEEVVDQVVADMILCYGSPCQPCVEDCIDYNGIFTEI